MIRGTNYDQDARFANKTQNMLSKSQWPDKYDIKVDLNKVHLLLLRLTTSSSKFGFKRESPNFLENRTI